MDLNEFARNLGIIFCEKQIFVSLFKITLKVKYTL